MHELAEVLAVSLHDGSERRRMSHPRKAYPVDPGLIAVYERMGRVNLGHALETAVLIELERRACQVGYIRTRDGFEVDFVARDTGGETNLLQVSADVGAPDAREREVRALAAAAREHPGARARLVTLDAIPPSPPLSGPLEWQAAAAWLLGD
jgi:uncharacterized protein